MNTIYDEEPCGKGCRGCSYCCDAYGVDAMKDANAEMGNRWDDPRGWAEAQDRGWTRGPNY